METVKNEKKSEQVLKLNLFQRFAILNMMPSKSSIVKMIAYRAINKKISVTQEEVKEFEIKDDFIKDKDGKEICVTSIVSKIDSTKDFVFTELEILELRDLLSNASKLKLISEHLIDLCIELQITE